MSDQFTTERANASLQDSFDSIAKDFRAKKIAFYERIKHGFEGIEPVDQHDLAETELKQLAVRLINFCDKQDSEFRLKNIKDRQDAEEFLLRRSLDYRMSNIG